METDKKATIKLMREVAYRSAKRMSEGYDAFVKEYNGGAVDIYHHDCASPVDLDVSIQRFCFDGMAKRFVRPRLSSGIEKAEPNNPLVVIWLVMRFSPAATY